MTNTARMTPSEQLRLAARLVAKAASQLDMTVLRDVCTECGRGRVFRNPTEATVHRDIESMAEKLTKQADRLDGDGN